MILIRRGLVARQIGLPCDFTLETMQLQGDTLALQQVNTLTD